MIGSGDEESEGGSTGETEVDRPLDEATTPPVASDFANDRATITEIEPAVDRAATRSLLTSASASMADVAIERKPSSLARPPSILPPPSTSGARIIDPLELAEIYVDRAMKRQDDGDHEGAVADYSKALDRAPSHLVAIYNRGVAHMALGRYEDASRDFVRALDLDGTLAEASYNNALALLVMGDKPRAASFAQHAEHYFEVRGDADMATKAREILVHVTSG